MRVLTIAQRLRQRPAHGAVLGRPAFQLQRHPARYGRIISCRTGIGSQRQILPVAQWCRAVVSAHLSQQRSIIRRVHHHIYKRMVLGRRTDHRRTANIDVFDTGVIIGTLRHRRLERIKVYHQQVDRPDTVFVHRHQVIFIIPQRQQPAMDHWVQRFHAAIHHLGKTRQLGHIPNLQPRVSQAARGAARADQFHAMLGQRLTQFDQAGFVGYGKQGPAHGLKIGHQ